MASGDTANVICDVSCTVPPTGMAGAERSVVIVGSYFRTVVLECACSSWSAPLQLLLDILSQRACQMKSI